ncbi:hypothetical protein [Candidatus Venteria ishoeyi]|uniref:Uncharacterized protein n=1 Tax=Candidatus Venteria ishoeyi TaxID=1899563 RepID=A0A1H6FAT4_9GAMM|nr:hypothetical protein [Candidatus Venteria ishoeyi]SEH06419.1 Uncharacterised protein [Candidatus Venteria ishoeyi]
MMGLLSKAESLRKEIQQLRALQENAQYVERFETRLENLSPVQKLQNLVLIYQTLKAKGVGISFDTNFATAIQIQLRKIKKRYQADPGMILATNKTLGNNFWTPLQQLPKKLQAALEKDWNSYVTSILPQFDTEILSVLAQIPDLQQQVVDIQRYYQEAEALSKQLPVDDSAFQHLDALVSLLTTKWKNLKGGGIPADILHFLKECAGSGANIEAMTPEILAWLKERGLLHSFKIVVG